jgi:hypothetical protein
MIGYQMIYFMMIVLPSRLCGGRLSATRLQGGRWSRRWRCGIRLSRGGWICGARWSNYGVSGLRMSNERISGNRRSG